MLDREPFLKAIFADPADDHPRLVFADWLDDRGDPDWAELIRLQCEVACRGPAHVGELAGREQELQTRRWPDCWLSRGLPSDKIIRVRVEELADPDEFRRSTCRAHPHWYGATELRVASGRISDPASVETLLRSPVTEHVTRLDLSGREEQLGTAHDDALGIGLIDFVYRPAVTPRMVEHLCGLREARRLVALDLTRNDLDNDAVRALARSTNLIRLKELTVQDGNPRVKGRLWAELQQRFGPEGVR